VSLLNKMLADLETRTAEAQQPSAAAPVLAGLQVVNEERRAAPLRWGLWMLLLAAALVFAGFRLYPLVQARWQQHTAATHAVASAHGRAPLETASGAAASGESSPVSAAAQVQHSETDAPEAAAIQHTASVAVNAMPGPASSGREAATAQEKAAAQKTAETIEEEPAASEAAVMALDEERPMSTTDFVALALPPVLGSLDVAEEPAPVDPLEPAPTPQEPPAAPAESSPTMEVSVVQPATSAHDGSLAAAPPAALGMAPAGIETQRNFPAARDRALPPADATPSPQPAPAAKSAPTRAGEAAIVKAPQQLSPEENAQDAYLNGLQRLSEGRLTEAEASFRDSLRLHPAQMDARVALAGLLRDQERVQEAQSLLEDGLTVTPGAGVLRQWLARLYLEQGFTERAVAILESGRPFAEEDGEYLAVLAAFYQQAGRFKAAADAYRQALSRDAQQGRWWMGLGLALESDGQPILAAQAYERALGTSGLPRELVPFTRARLAAARQDAR